MYEIIVRILTITIIIIIIIIIIMIMIIMMMMIKIMIFIMVMIIIVMMMIVITTIICFIWNSEIFFLVEWRKLGNQKTTSTHVVLERGKHSHFCSIPDHQSLNGVLYLPICGIPTSLINYLQPYCGSSVASGKCSTHLINECLFSNIISQNNFWASIFPHLILDSNKMQIYVMVNESY